MLVVITDVPGRYGAHAVHQRTHAALRYINWDLRRNREPIGPAARRDSIRTATRRTFVQDSVRAAFRDSTGRVAVAAMQGPPG